MKVACLLLAGGIGSRMESETPKQFLPLLDKQVIEHSIEALSHLNELIVVADKKWHHLLPKDAIIAEAGLLRQDSMLCGLQKLSNQSDIVLIHDAARPLLSKELINKVIQGAKEFGACAPALPIKGTVKVKNNNDFVTQTLDRSQLVEMQTPQAINRKLLNEACEWIQKKEVTVTDDVSMIELFGHPVKLILGDEKNIKITTPIDLQIAETLLLNSCLV